uniref:Uncharacterized protein n=2 Tax=Caenorhabditis japonica TaxID=281687 RepID=A0A8R1E626_CAEJA
MNTSTHRGSNRRTAAKNINSVNELLAAYVKHNDFTMATMKDIMNGTALSEEQYQTLFKANNIGLPAMSQVVLNFVQQMSIMQMQTPQGNFAQILASLAALTNHAEPVKELASPEKKDMFLIDNILVDHLELEDEISMMKSSCKQLQVGNEQTAINNNNTKKLKRKIRTSIEKSATEKEKDVPPIVLDPVNPATEHVVLRSKKSTADCSQGSQSPYSEPVAKSTRSELEAYDIDTIFMALINEKPGDSHKSTKDIVSEYDSGVSQSKPESMHTLKQGWDQK